MAVKSKIWIEFLFIFCLAPKMGLTVWSNSSHITLSQSSNLSRGEQEKYAYYSDIQHYDLLSCTCIKANVNLMQCEENFKAVSLFLSSLCFLIDSVCCFFLRWRHVLAAIINLPWYLIKDTSPPIRNLSVCRSVCLSDNFLACQIETEGDKFVFYFLSYWRKTTRFQNLKKMKRDNSQTLLTVTPSGRNLSRFAWGMMKQSLPWAWLAISSSLSLWASSLVIGPRGRPRGGAGGPPPAGEQCEVRGWRRERARVLRSRGRVFTLLLSSIET